MQGAACVGTGDALHIKIVILHAQRFYAGRNFPIKRVVCFFLEFAPMGRKPQLEAAFMAKHLTNRLLTNIITLDQGID
jgi:hypothetical protein